MRVVQFNTPLLLDRLMFASWFASGWEVLPLGTCRVCSTSREELEELYQNNRKGVDHVMSLDGGMTFLDGYERSQQDKETGRFSPVFLTHANKDQSGCNCMRLSQDQQVAFFTARAAQAGEELCFDYVAKIVGKEMQRTKCNVMTMMLPCGRCMAFIHSFFRT